MHLCFVSLSAALLITGCALKTTATGQPAARAAELLPADALLLGEQHDSPNHQEFHRQVIQSLIAQRKLAAVALEMAEQGTFTTELAPDASEAAVRSALRWSDQAWPWKAYGPVVMTAVRAGVPVLGANLPSARMRATMNDAGLDAMLPADGLRRQEQAIRDGHCGLLPEHQIVPMTRIQIARDRSMAQTVANAAVRGKTVVLVAGGAHVDDLIGVPRHLPPAFRSRSLQWPAAAPLEDYCAQLRQRINPRQSVSNPAAAPARI